MGLFVPHSHHGPQKLSVHVQATNVVSDYDEKTTATTSLAALSPLKGKQQQRQRCCIYKKKPNNKIKKKKKKKQTKRVLFAAAQETDTNTDTTTNIATTDLTIDYYANATLSQSELKNPTIKKKLWWTKQDRLQSTKESLVLLRAFKVKNVQDIENYHQIYKTSILMYSSPSQIVSDSLENVTVSIPLSIRGLEWGLSLSSFGSGSSKSKVDGGKVGGGGGGGMSSVKSRRKQHIENILAVQKHIKDQEIRQRFISSRSLQSSRPSRIMARMIGEGDALKSFSNQLQTTNTTTTTDNNNNSSGITTDSSLSTSSSSAAATTTTTKNNLKQQQQKKGMETSTSSRHTTSTTRRATTKVTSTKKIGHVRKRRRQLLWRK